MPKYYNASMRNLVYRLRKFKPILEQCLKEEIENHADILCQWTRERLWIGLDGYLKSIKPPYAQRTIKKKLRKGQPVDRVTLRDTGEFYASFYIEFDADGFRVVSNDEKAKFLLAKYGEQILRISNGDFNYFIREYIRPILMKRLKEYIENGRA